MTSDARDTTDPITRPTITLMTTVPPTTPMAMVRAWAPWT
jgi:hypothetical protein